ncbi:MAG: hypothetical protein KDB80_15345 [Planctomycetes bacterium]|nr:hypothetical protein [Planctomycetota bacterium]
MLRPLALAISLACVISQARAQLTTLPGTGCRNGDNNVPPITAVGGAAPTIGNQTFTLRYPCPAAANLAFLIFGTCQPAGPVSDWDLSGACFAIWPSPPATCGAAFQSVIWIDAVTPFGGIANYPLPIPPIPSLPALMQATPLCLQFVPAIVAPAPALTITCVEVSAGARLIAQ